jgi:hypothetical protein
MKGLLFIVINAGRGAKVLRNSSETRMGILRQKLRGEKCRDLWGMRRILAQLEISTARMVGARPGKMRSSVEFVEV